MKILHYALGFPPYRSGGLTKYVYDLMLGQAEEENDVSMLWPGRYSVKQSVQSVKYSQRGALGSYELFNPLPVPLLSGIERIELYTQHGDIELYTEVLKSISPQVIHMHTLMGIHLAFLQAAHNLEIPVVYTTHDYFGLCPKANLFFQGQVCNAMEDKKCSRCNVGAISYKKIRMMQSYPYQVFKEPMKRLQLKRILKQSNRTENRSMDEDKVSVRSYDSLLSYYKKAFSLVRFFHFNSSLSKQVYCAHLQESHLDGEVITITHRNIEDHRNRKMLNDPICFAFLGDAREDKGFNLLIKALDCLLEEGYRFRLNVYGNVSLKRSYLCEAGQYRYSDLEEIFQKTDALIVPSVWPETFGFVAIEAKSHAVPVIMTTNVGAKDCFTDGIDAVITEAEPEQLELGIKRVLDDKNLLVSMNEEIMEEPFPFSHTKHVKKILDVYCSIQETI